MDYYHLSERETKGTCRPCNHVYHWRAALRLRLTAAKCPNCGKPLTRTSSLLRGASHFEWRPGQHWDDGTPALYPMSPTGC